MLEEAKFDAQKTMYEMVRSGRQMKPEMINNIIKLEEIKAHDKFYLEMGFEDEELDINIERQGLKDDEALKEVFDTWAKKSADWLQLKSDEAKEMRAKMQEYREAQEKEAAKKEAEKKEEVVVEAEKKEEVEKVEEVEAEKVEVEKVEETVEEK